MSVRVSAPAPATTTTSWASLFTANKPATGVPPNKRIPTGYMSYAVMSAKDQQERVVRPNTSQVPESELSQREGSSGDLKECAGVYAKFRMETMTNQKAVTLHPRGLINRSNYCYANAVLQALVGCPAFRILIRSLPRKKIMMSGIRLPMVEAMAEFGQRFSTTTNGGGGKPNNAAFEPTFVRKVWNNSRDAYTLGRQEDAQEFLSFVLNKMH